MRGLDKQRERERERERDYCRADFQERRRTICFRERGGGEGLGRKALFARANQKRAEQAKAGLLKLLGRH